MPSKKLKTVFTLALILLVFCVLYTIVSADYAPEADVTSAAVTTPARMTTSPENTAVPSLTTTPDTANPGHTALESTQPIMEGDASDQGSTTGSDISASGGIIGITVAVIAAIAAVVVIFVVAPKGKV